MSATGIPRSERLQRKVWETKDPGKIDILCSFRMFDLERVFSMVFCQLPFLLIRLELLFWKCILLLIAKKEPKFFLSKIVLRSSLLSSRIICINCVRLTKDYHCYHSHEHAFRTNYRQLL